MPSPSRSACSSGRFCCGSSRKSYLSSKPTTHCRTRHFINGSIPCAFATYIYVSRRLGIHRVAMLRAAQFERARASRQVLESRLQAMQARVEPQFLFNTLALVEQLYESETKAADE